MFGVRIMWTCVPAHRKRARSAAQSRKGFTPAHQLQMQHSTRESACPVCGRAFGACCQGQRRAVQIPQEFRFKTKKFEDARRVLVRTTPVVGVVER